MDVEVVVCPIVREKDGLAMSSRNVYLSPEQRQQALVLHRALMRVQTMADRGEHDAATLVEIGKQVIAEEPAARLDYFAIVDAGRSMRLLTSPTGRWQRLLRTLGRRG